MARLVRQKKTHINLRGCPDKYIPNMFQFRDRMSEVPRVKIDATKLIEAKTAFNEFKKVLSLAPPR